ncbi:MAG: metallophosphoesterase [Acidobacteriia bacterium]|nr:metallophosphoesterase [Terriglobia bacterium]
MAFSLLGVNPVAATPQQPAPKRHSRTKPKQKPVPQPATLVGAGDIADCGELGGAEITAKLIESIPGTVFAAGDLAYEHGSAREFADCYGKTWGRFKDRTRPALGNHEYGSWKAAPYFAYWGQAAGPVDAGYYSYDLGAWHIIVLNTNCSEPRLGGCFPGSPQEHWLRQDLAAHPAACTLAYGHYALFSSGIFSRHALHPELRPLWQALYEAHAELILAGHEHSYERFAPQDPLGNPDPANGIREIVVGTGGGSHTPLGSAIANSELRNTNTFGVLKLTLGASSYSWEFIPEPGESFRDSGSAICHPRAAGPVEKKPAKP